MGKKMMHIGLEKGQIGRYVFLPGSPERTEKIAAYFENPKEIAYNREFRTFVGQLNGVDVAVTSTGIGGPSAAIAVEELYQCGADTMMRVGTCASVSPKVSIGDIVIPNGAVKMEGVSHHYLPVEFPSVPDFQMLKAIEQAAINLGLPYDVGVTITKASFYTQTSPQTKPVGPELIYKWEAYKKGGASSTSMECAPLFAVGASLGIRTSCVMASATNYKSGKVKEGSEKVNVEDRAIRTAIEAMKIIIREDQKGE
ncbi:nucleoside phosphorylase [Enterocloster sp.]|uniref:nucleoside phosphorylase n=1 Tax=Enterocloster sp. TaxID=2719315 RepID=UPI003AB5AB63